MMPNIQVVGLGGSLAARSTSRWTLGLALEGARASGAETQQLDLRALGLPLYDPGVEPVPASAEALARAVREADALIWSTPLYHGSLSGAFKNALDWLELLSEDEHPYLTGKAVGLISTAGGTHGLQAINQMENIVRALRGYTVPFVVPVPRAWKQFDREGVLSFGGSFTSSVRKLSGQRCA